MTVVHQVAVVASRRRPLTEPPLSGPQRECRLAVSIVSKRCKAGLGRPQVDGSNVSITGQHEQPLMCASGLARCPINFAILR